MNNFGTKIRKISLFFGDIILLYFSLFLTLILRYQSNFNQEIWQVHWPIFSGPFIVWLIIFYSFNLYELSIGKNLFKLFNNYLPAIILNLLIGVVYFYILSPKTNITPKTILVILTIIFTIFFFLWRKLITKITSSDKLYQNLLFIGYQPLVNSLLPPPGTNRRFGFVYEGIATDIPLDKLNITIPHYQFNQIEEVIKNKKINLVVINEPDKQASTDILFRALPLKVSFISLTNFYEQVNQRIPLEIINRGWFLDNLSEGNKAFFESIKRLFDIVLAIISGTISLPLIPFIILAITLDSKGKIIFKQKRLGKAGKIFTALKFRTMFSNAEKTGPMWARENDPRITKIGKFLRKTRLDEIPQLWNILKGEMSFVGPRPERPEFTEDLKNKIPFYKERLLVKPGLTGWAQINFPYADSVESSLKKLQFDLFYIKHRSMFLDLTILLKTINIVLKGGGR